MQQNNNQLPAYELLSASLRRVNSQLSAAECHGVLTGALNTEDTTLISRFFLDGNDQLQADDAFAELISNIVHLTSEGFKDEDFNFQLLLPSDETPLPERTRALADWCGGYLMGLLESGVKEFEALPEDATEIAKDLVEISQLESSDDDSGSESDLMELEEYVRVGVQIMYAVLTKTRNVENEQDGEGMNEQFAKRRDEVMQMMGGGVAIIPTSRESVRSRDVMYPFRASSDFYYLTHFNEPEAVAVLVPGREHGEFILFCRERDPEKEIWDGRRAGLEGACEYYGADDAFPITDIDEIVPGLLENREKVFYSMGANDEFDSRLMTWVNEVRSKSRKGISAPTEILDLGHILHEMRLVKRCEEKALIQKACKISARAHKQAMKVCKPGMKEYEIEAEFQYIFRKKGSEYPAYPPIVATGENACVLHYVENRAVLKDGDMLLIDAGCEIDGYAADISRTFPVNGKFSDEQRALYQVVLNAQQAAIDTIKPGVTWDVPHNAAVRVITAGLVEHGLLQGDVDELIASSAYQRFYMHKTGHWLGLDVHDVGD
ncbi:MAG: aminopeptidase P N-terminal domain-containing protein, partial [Gammaproteobacteria bacterium]|nr:aminopeptidase P N-terminal domain-containing protein [Gammaproteobacteria bacterium]